MYSSAEISRRDFGNISQLTNWILDSGVTCQMIPEIPDFILVSSVETDKYIVTAFGILFIAEQTG